MTSISAFNPANTIASLLDPTATNTLTTKPGNSSEASPLSPSTLVTLGAMTPVQSIYSMLDGSASPVWETSSNNAISSLMGINFSALSGAQQFEGLGAALLNQIGSFGNSFSQSVMLAGANASPTAIANAQSQLHSSAANEITLDVTTKSGAKVEVTLDSDTNGLAVRVDVTNGTLSATDKTALARLSNGFQSAIDGLTEEPPTINLGGLMQFDSSDISSIDFQASVQGATGTQTVDLHADTQKRSLSASGPDGTIKLNIDMSNLMIIGSAQQQAAAIQSYLQQFDNEQSRGHGNVALMSMFDSAFSELNSNYPVGPTSADFNASSALPDTAQSMLTGLADFTASVAQTPVSSNSLKPKETDTFDYEVSQSTETESDRANLSIDQHQSSHLSASFHTALQGMQLALGDTPQSQNYNYYQIDDFASSNAQVAFRKGELVKATLDHSAAQSTYKQQYVQGLLMQNIELPPETQSFSKNMLYLLDQLPTSAQPATGTPPASSASADQAEAISQQVNRFVGLQVNPSDVLFAGKQD